jgi:isoleucyl-tRNA synthetase
LQKIKIPVLDESIKQKIESVKDLILAEVNVKEMEFVDEKTSNIVKNLKLNFKTLGKKCGKHMKAVQAYAAENAQNIIKSIEQNGMYDIPVEGEIIRLEPEDVEIIPVDIPGWKVANNGGLTVALDITITEKLKSEGLARELVNRVQNLRKDNGLEVTDRILLKINANDAIKYAINQNLDYICSEILASSIDFVSELNEKDAVEVEIEEGINTLLLIDKIS